MSGRKPWWCVLKLLQVVKWITVLMVIAWASWVLTNRYQPTWVIFSGPILSIVFVASWLLEGEAAYRARRAA